MFSFVILLSVFANTGISVSAQAIDYLSDADPSGILKDTGNSEYTVISPAGKVTGKSGAIYEKGVRVKLTRDSDDGMSFMTLTYDVKNNASSFSCYLDADENSENDSNYSVKFEVFAGESVVFTQMLTPSTKYPIKVNASFSNAEKITVRLGDTAPNEGETAFVLGNAAMCESGSSIPSVTVPNQPDEDEDEEEESNTDSNNNNNNNGDPVTDLTVNSQELLAKATKYMGHSYLLVTMQLSWDQAATWCEMQGGYLATVTSESENKFIADYLRSLGNRSAYLGMSNSGENGDFKWQNGETALYFNWARHSTIPSGKVYMQMGGGSDEWSMGKADGQYLSFVIEWGDKAPLADSGSQKPESAVIVIAGLGGSNLSDSDTGREWAKKAENYYELSVGNVPWGKSSVGISDSEYGTADTYKLMMEGISKVCSDSDIVLFEWDWRGSAADGAGKLDEFIKKGGWKKVSLIGHNTGGLVACHYMNEKGTDSVERFIALGTPFYGTEKAFSIMQTGTFAQGALSTKGTVADVSKFPSLASLVPNEPKAGAESFTGKLISPMTREDILEAVGADSKTKADSDSLDKIYKLICDGGFGGAYIVAGTGTATVESSVIAEGGIIGLNTSFDGDGLTGIDSASMNFKSARPPYIIENCDVTELVTDKDSIALVCNILSGAADTSDFANGMSKTVYRTRTVSDKKPMEISISGSAKITVVEDSHSVTLHGNSFAFSKGSQEAVIFKNGIKTVFASEEAQINIEVLGSGVCFEIKGKNGTRTWSDIPLGAGAILKTTASSDVLSVVTDPGNSGLSEIKPDAAPVVLRENEEVIEETEEKKDTAIAWNLWAAGGLIITAAAVALILMPYFAYRISKVETDRKKRAIKQRLRRQRQQLRQLQQNMSAVQTMNPAMPQQNPFFGDMPMLISPQSGEATFDINEVIDENIGIDLENMINGQ